MNSVVPGLRRAETPADSLAASRIKYAADPPDVPWEYFAAIRLQAPRLQRGVTWLLEAENEDVASLVCYPLQFGTPEGDVLPGYGFGSVCTTIVDSPTAEAGYTVMAVASAGCARGRAKGRRSLVVER